MTNAPTADPRKLRLDKYKIKALATDRARTIDYLDTLVPGLRVRVTPGGVKSFGLRNDFGGKTRRLDYGRCFIDLTLDEARERAISHRRLLGKGIDPAIPAPVAKPVPTFAEIVERWKLHKEIGEKHRQWKAAYRTVKRYAMPDAGTWPGLPAARRAELSLAERPCNAITRKDVVRILEWIRDDLGLEGTVNSAHVALASVFTFALNAGEIEAHQHPLIRFKKMVRKTKRDRVLSVDELVAVWRACDQIGDDAAACVRILILTLQRRAEVSGLRRAEIVYGGSLWILPAARRKQNNNHTKQAHPVPLAAAAQAIIAARPRWNAGDYVFGKDGTAPFQGWSAAVKKLKAVAKLDTPWTIHDLRRSGRTLWSQELKLPYELGERALGHSLGGETETYDHSTRLEDLRDCFERWEAFLALKVAQAMGVNVVTLPAAA